MNFDKTLLSNKTFLLIAIMVAALLITTLFISGDDGWLSNLWLVSVFKKGGLVMWPILFCSILAVGVSLERTFTLRRSKIIDPGFHSQIRRLSQRGDFERAQALCRSSDSAMARIVRAGLQRATHGLLEIERAIETTGAHEATLLQNNLRALGALANITPMLGLLGTVVGMIKAFDVISEAGTGNPGLVASGISEALITTAAGLIIGIPTLAAYHYFRGKVDRIVYEMEEVSLILVEDIQVALIKDDRPKYDHARDREI